MKTFNRMIMERKEAIEVIKKNWPDSSFIILREALETVIPELKENEDERIRKDLISHFKETIDNIRSEEIIPHNAKILVGKMQKWIAWLEKQGKQKPAWNEEDNDMLYKVIHRIEQLDYYWNATTDMKMIDWLKSLKDRVQPQPKQEWSKEEQQIIEDAACIILDCVNTAETKKEEERLEELADKLQDLRPQNRCGWNDMSVKPIYPCDILYQQPNGNIFIYRYMEGGRANDAQTPTFCNLDENGKWIYLKDVKPQNTLKPSDEHYELEEFAKIVRSNLTGITKAVQELFEAKYLQLTGNKMYGGFKD